MSENDPTEGEETITLSVSSVVGADENGDQAVTLNLTETSCENVDKELFSSITEDLTLFELCSPYSVPADKNLLRIREGYTVLLKMVQFLIFLGQSKQFLSGYSYY